MRDERKCWSMKDRDHKPVILHNETFKYTGGRVPPFSLHLLFFSLASIFNSLTPLPLILHRHIHYSALSLFIVLHLFFSMKECFRVNTLQPYFFLSLSVTHSLSQSFYLLIPFNTKTKDSQPQLEAARRKHGRRRWASKLCLLAAGSSFLRTMVLFQSLSPSRQPLLKDTRSSASSDVSGSSSGNDVTSQTRLAALKVQQTLLQRALSVEDKLPDPVRTGVGKMSVWQALCLSSVRIRWWRLCESTAI